MKVRIVERADVLKIVDLLRAQEVVERPPPLAGEQAHLGGHAGQQPHGGKHGRTAEDDQEREPSRRRACCEVGRERASEERREQAEEDGERGARLPLDLPLGLTLCPAHLPDRVRRATRRDIPQSGEATAAFCRSMRS